MCIMYLDFFLSYASTANPYTTNNNNDSDNKWFIDKRCAAQDLKIYSMTGLKI